MAVTLKKTGILIRKRNLPSEKIYSAFEGEMSMDKNDSPIQIPYTLRANIDFLLRI
jgi:hypothetical protein